MTLALAQTVLPPKAIDPLLRRAAGATLQLDTGLRLRRFSVEEYQRLIREGFFGPHEKCELLEGLVIDKMSRDPIHDIAIEIADEVLRARLPAGWRIRFQSATVTTDSQPEPDVAVVRGAPRERLGRHPGSSELALVVEVANSSLADDRLLKGRIYARAGIAVYWIINLIDRRVEVYTDPTGPDPAPAYRRRDDFAIGQFIPFVIDGVERGPIAVADLLP